MKERLWLPLITCLAYCIDKELYKAIDYLREQVRVLIEQQEKQNKRILLTNNQRMRVATKAKRLSRKMLERCTELFTAPDTIMRWHQKLIAEKYDGSNNRMYSGRPPITQEVVNLVIRFKEENPRWGYQKIRDQIVYLGHAISKSSVKNILIENGYDPEPDLTVRSTWHEFIKSHWDVLAACDFFSIELLVGRKLVRCTVFFVIELATRKVFYAPIKLQPDGAYMKQVAKLLVDSEDGFLQGKHYLIHDRDPLYRTDGFHKILESIGVETIAASCAQPKFGFLCGTLRQIRKIRVFGSLDSVLGRAITVCLIRVPQVLLFSSILPPEAMCMI